MAGVPFEPIEKLATPGTGAAARELLTRRDECARAKSEVRSELRSQVLSKEESQIWREAIRRGAAPTLAKTPSRSFAPYLEEMASAAAAEERLDNVLGEELERSRGALASAVQTFVAKYLVFVGRELADRLLRQISNGAGSHARNKGDRSRDRTLLLYLQRICAKNDSLSAFGPCGWGSIRPDISGLTLRPQSGIAQRESFLERWTAQGAVAALNADLETRMEVSPRLEPDSPIRVDESGQVGPEQAQKLRTLLERCDGKTAAHLLGVDRESLEQLVRQKMIRWELEVPALDPYAFETLVGDVRQWREGPVRRRWLEVLEPIAELPAKFRNASETGIRAQIMSEAQARLDRLGAHHAASGRFLYAATNPIGEECLRQCNFVISEKLMNEVTTEAAPWIDLWRDCYAFVASRVAGGLRQILERSNRESVPLPTFLRLCETANLSLRGPGLVALAHLAFQEIKQAFSELMRPHANAAEYELTAGDCHFVRRNFHYDKFDEYTYPSADLQLAAKSVEAVGHGDYQWILAELHPPVALLHHGFYWSCPDKPALSAALAKTVFGKPNFYFGFSAADFTATTSVRIFDGLPSLTHFVAPERPNPNWQAILPRETEVYVDRETGDVCLRRTDNQEYLGSFARAWLIPLGFHPFQFGMAPHMPRLRCGKVIVQRRAWTIAFEELGEGDFSGVSRNLVLAVEKLRATRGLPRFVYVRPTEKALRRSGAEGRDKDTKPVFIDLESYLFLEIFHRWLSKAGELEVTEMLPAPDDLLWQEPDGRRTFELRTLIVPRS